MMIHNVFHVLLLKFLKKFLFKQADKILKSVIIDKKKEYVI